MYEKFMIPDKELARNFLAFREHGDDQALHYLDDTMENRFGRNDRLKYTAVRRVVRSALDLNYVVALMEFDEIPFNSDIEQAYRSLMGALTNAAEEAK